MADNVVLGSVTYATDDISGVQYPREKMVFGADGVATDVSTANPLPVTAIGGATQATLASIDADIGLTTDAAASTDTGTASLVSLVKRLLTKTPTTLTNTPSQDDVAQPVRTTGQFVDNAGFGAVGSSVLDVFFNAPIVGTGVTYNQGSGSLNILSGTTINAEFLARSARVYRGSMRLRFTTTLSQRIANNNFAVVLGDLVGAGLTYNIVNTTTVDVTLTAHGFTAQNVGQFVNLGGITGAAGVPGRYAIASIPDANTIRFTVAGWPASGTGTLTAFGRNYVRHLFNGTTATNVAVDAQRNGWATGDTTATINTTASPGTMLQTELTGREIFFADALRASSTTPTVTTRASRVENIPDMTTDLYVWLWSFNGTTAPASTTTWTLGHLAVESYPNVPVYVQGIRANGQQNAVPVTLTGTNNIGTVTTVSTVTSVSSVAAIAAGTTAIGDVGIQYRANATGAASKTHLVSAASTNATIVKNAAGRLIGWRVSNTNAAYRYVKLHNQTTTPTAGTGVVETIAVPPNSITTGHITGGSAFTTGIGMTTTTGAADNDTAAVGANDLIIDLYWA